MPLETIETYEQVRAWTPATSSLPSLRGPRYDYIWSRAARLAVQVALVTERALLLKGEPGIGKTTLAEAAAAALDWRYYRHTITSQTQAAHILWRFDLVRRLADAQPGAGGLKPDAAYVEPREFWWAFDPDSARRRGDSTPGPDPRISAAIEPNAGINQPRSPKHAVILVDEIDKADPDVANDMLELLAERRFTVDNAGAVTEVCWSGTAQDLPPLLVLTTNDERDLPEAFLRRCIVHTMRWPGEAEGEEERREGRGHLLAVMEAHWTSLDGAWDAAAKDIAQFLIERIEEERRAAAGRGHRKPGLAELIDAVRAARRFSITREDPLWDSLLRLAWRKTPDFAEA